VNQLRLLELHRRDDALHLQSQQKEQVLQVVLHRRE
jgi:hypothetical protein